MLNDVPASGIAGLSRMLTRILCLTKKQVGIYKSLTITVIAKNGS